MTSYQYA